MQVRLKYILLAVVLCSASTMALAQNQQCVSFGIATQPNGNFADSFQGVVNNSPFTGAGVASYDGQGSGKFVGWITIGGVNSGLFNTTFKVKPSTNCLIIVTFDDGSPLKGFVKQGVFQSDKEIHYQGKGALGGTVLGSEKQIDQPNSFKRFD
jgi:hypothetical protein